ncbi:hypothetical protein JCM10450v2_004601 [Rhodotorula kratochvilovae]
MRPHWSQADGWSFLDLIHLVAPYPPGHARALPIPPADDPWHILPAAFAAIPVPWDVQPAPGTLDDAQALHAQALDEARAIWAATPRDEAAARAAHNRKKKARRARNAARKNGEEGDGDEASPDRQLLAILDSTEGTDEARTVTIRPDGVREIADNAYARAALQRAENVAAIRAPKLSFVQEGVRPVWGLPPSLPLGVYARFVDVYVELHEEFTQDRLSHLRDWLANSPAEVPTALGHAYLLPCSRGRKTRWATSFEPGTRRVLYHREIEQESTPWFARNSR